MKRQIILLLLCVGAQLSAWAQPGYVPTAENKARREAFRAEQFGLFVHWGLYSQLADGEWVQYHQRIPVANYKNLASTFYPQAFNAEEWVLTAKRAGMKYITVTSKHHDGFCLWDSKVTTYDIMDATPFKRDIIKELAEACRKHGVTLCLYYSLLDWQHPDYTLKGKHGVTGVMGGQPSGDHSRYVDYMCAQLTELLTQYGPIGAIWFDGEWEALEAPWNFDKVYSTIHKAQPACLIGNNHHRNVRPGEDFQLFEKDLPGDNSHGWVDHAASVAQLPLEMCETMNGSWGYNLQDRKFKSAKSLTQLLIRSAGADANLLLNVGPRPDGRIQSEMVDTLAKIGTWLQNYGPSLYNTRGGIRRSWGVTTQKGNKLYIHLLKPEDPLLFLPLADKKVKSLKRWGSADKISWKQDKSGLFITLPASLDPVDTVFEVEL